MSAASLRITASEAQLDQCGLRHRSHAQSVMKLCHNAKRRAGLISCRFQSCSSGFVARNSGFSSSRSCRITSHATVSDCMIRTCVSCIRAGSASAIDLIPGDTQGIGIVWVDDHAGRSFIPARRLQAVPCRRVRRATPIQPAISHLRLRTTAHISASEISPRWEPPVNCSEADCCGLDLVSFPKETPSRVANSTSHFSSRSATKRYGMNLQKSQPRVDTSNR